MKKKELIKPNQIGFRKGYRTSDHVFVLKTLIDPYKTHNKIIYACFVDLRKDYDTVWRNGLFYKLMKIGISKRLLSLLIDMYSKSSSSVKLKSGLTPPFYTNVGVKQGCNLSPTLFNIFVNDIIEIFDSKCNPVNLGNCSINCLLYADDLILLSESESGLQQSLNSYTKRWKMTINMKKLKSLFLTNWQESQSQFFYKW